MVSTYMAFVDLVDKFFNAEESNKQIVGIFPIDLSKSFDTFDHDDILGYYVNLCTMDLEEQTLTGLKAAV